MPEYWAISLAFLSALWRWTHLSDIEVFARMGYEDVALKVQELYLQGKKAEAAAAIPLKMVEDVALVGPIDKIKDELVQWKETCITTFLLSGPSQMLEFYADLING